MCLFCARHCSRHFTVYGFIQPLQPTSKAEQTLISAILQMGTENYGQKFLYIVQEVVNNKTIPMKKKSDQIRSVAQSCPTLCDPMNRSTPGLPVHHQLPKFTQTHVHRVSNAIQPSYPLSSPSPLAPNPSQHQSLFQ